MAVPGDLDRSPASADRGRRHDATADQASGITVVTDRGDLAGGWQGDVAVFRGVPYAAPPVGPARWRPPQPPPAWQGARPATEFAAVPVQRQPRRNSIMFQLNFADRRELTMSEDCLYLNIWSPEPERHAGLPVMVWLHGGGNRFGHGSQDIYDGRSLARQGIVVVTLNYRLGALGFLAHPGLSRESPGHGSGNYALLDVVAALEWVQRNIAAFGGDPGRVTVAGNSAGAAFIAHLMAAQRSRGLFSQVIAQSSSGVYRAEGPMRSLAEAEAAGERFAAEVGCPDAAALRQVSAVELMAAGDFGIVIDGRIVTADTQRAFEDGSQAACPMIVGTNLDDGANYTPATAAAGLGAQANRLGELAAGFRLVYPSADPDQARASARDFVSDSKFVFPVWQWAVTHEKTSGAPVWMYRFDREPPLPAGLVLAPPMDGGGYGVFHTAELPYVFDSLGARDWDWAQADHHLARVMSAAWARFVATGDPSGGTTPSWPRFTGRDDADIMWFGAAVRTGPHDRIAAMRLHQARRGVPG